MSRSTMATRQENRDLRCSHNAHPNTSLKAKATASRSQRGAFHKLLKVQFTAPLVLESISMAVSKMKLLASFQEACQLASSGKLPGHSLLNISPSLEGGNSRCLYLLRLLFHSAFEGSSVCSLHEVSALKYFLRMSVAYLKCSCENHFASPSRMADHLQNHDKFSFMQ